MSSPTTFPQVPTSLPAACPAVASAASASASADPRERPRARVVPRAEQPAEASASAVRPARPSSGRVRSAPGPVAPCPVRPAGRRDAVRPAGRAGALSLPPVRPLPSAAPHGGGRASGHAVWSGSARPEVVRRRRAVAVAVLAVVLAGLLVVAVRLVAGAPGAEGTAPVPAGSAVTVVAPGESLVDVARRTAPGADTDAVVARIRADNGLSSSLVASGRPLVVPAGS